MKGISDVEKKIIVAKTIERKIKIKKPEKIQTIEKKQKTQEKGDISIEKKLKALINLQQIDSQIDKIRIIRGELPLEVQDLEDEIAGIQTRIENYTNEVNAIDEAVAERKNAIKQCQTLIKKYEAQQSNVRNNREYDSLSKEIEFQNLEIQLCEKRIKEYKVTLETKKEIISSSQKQLDEKLHDAKIKKAELNDIVEETEKEESTLLAKSKGNQKIIEERLLTAYKKIRKNARNGLAVVVVERDACGGCFNKIPPQRQLDIRIRKKIIVCEYCGRILVDSGIIQS
jgi:predicted  nucleic acid-binding Zn-ribbon protein